MGSQPEYRPEAAGVILARILRRGKSFMHWVEIVTSAEFAEPVPSDSSEADFVLRLDTEPTLADGLSGCEQAVYSLLGLGDWADLINLIEAKVTTADHSGETDRPSRR